MCQEVKMSNDWPVKPANKSDRKRGGVNITTETIQMPVRGYERVEVVLKAGGYRGSYKIHIEKESCTVLN